MHYLLLACTMALVGGLSGVGKAWSQGWPSKPIPGVVPLTPGAATDIMARTVLEQVSAQLGQPIVVENRPGAGNTIGMAAVAKADPDGYTILVNSSTHTVSPVTRSSLPFDAASDLAAVIPLGHMPVVMEIGRASCRERV